MLSTPLSARRTQTRRARRAYSPVSESLEPRTVAAAGPATGIAAFLPAHTPLTSALHADQTGVPVALGTLTGEVANSVTQNGMPRVPVELINQHGTIVKIARTNAHGGFAFPVYKVGGFVVRAFTPRGFTQTTPTFTSTPPVGTYISGYNSSSWNYGKNTNPALGPVGPGGWASISTVGHDPFGSPINLKGRPINLGGVLETHYVNAVPRDVYNNGHELQIRWNTSQNETIKVGGQTFTLSQIHLHSPAENLVGGRRYAMEMHFVNHSPAGAASVLAVFLAPGPHNNALDPILNAASQTTPGTSAPLTTPVDFAGLLPTNQNGWYFSGSLTSPPLSRPLNWFVFATPITLDRQQFAQYASIARASNFFPNARPVQPLDGRIPNQLTYNVNFQNQSVAGLNFGLTPNPAGI